MKRSFLTLVAVVCSLATIQKVEAQTVCSALSVVNLTEGSCVVDGSVLAKDQLTSSCNTTTIANTQYIAGNAIDLVDGFDSGVGSSFDAYLSPCTALQSLTDNNQVEAKNATTHSSDTEQSTSTLAARSIDVRLFPNPVSEILHIQWNGEGETPYGLTVYDLQGKQLQQHNIQNVAQHDLDVSGLAAGIYVLELRYQKHSPIQQRFVKQ